VVTVEDGRLVRVRIFNTKA
jgi:ketosteroid isomerase-like protein